LDKFVGVRSSFQEGKIRLAVEFNVGGHIGSILSKTAGF